MSHAVHVTVAPDEVYLAPGGRRDVKLTVQNTGRSVEHYRLDVRGIPAAWYDLDQPHLALPMLARAHVHLAVHPPAGATSTAGRYPITVQVTSEDDPTHRAAAGFVLTVGGGSGLDMDVLPAEATGREATFQIAFLNQSPAPAVVALAARDSEDALCVHIEPPDPVVVPTGATEALATVHVRPRERGTEGGPERYEIEFRGRRVGSEHPSTPDLVAHARFTYVPRPAMLQRPVWLRRLPVSTLALMLTLLLVLLLQAYLATQPNAAPPAVPTPVLPTVAPRPSVAPLTGVGGDVPSIQSFTLVQTQPSLPYMLVWQTRNASSVTLNGRRVAPQGRLALAPPLASTTYQLVARRGRRSVTQQVHIVLRPAASGTQARASTPGAQTFVLALPRIVTLALQRRMSTLVVVWQVRDAAQVWLQTQAVPSSGERPVPTGAAVLWLTAHNAVGSTRRSLQLPSTAATGTPIPTTVTTATPIPTAAATGTPIPAAAASPPAVVLIPDTVSFGTQDVHTTSVPRAVHIVNLGPTALTIAGVSITGANPRDFSASDACAGTTTGTYNGCTISISFTPGQRGPRRASLVIADNAVDTPQIVALSGDGGRPVL